MKPFILLLLLVSLLSCEEDTHCFQCSQSEAGQTEEFTRCDITENEAADIERAGSEFDPRYHGGVVFKKRTTCVKVD